MGTTYNGSMYDFMENIIQGKEKVDFDFDIDEGFENELIKAMA